MNWKCHEGTNFMFDSMIFWRRKWHPTLVLLPGKSHGWRSLVGCSPWGRWVGHVWVTSLSCLGEGNGNPLQCSCLENPRDRGAWWASVYGSHKVRHNWSDLAPAAAMIFISLASTTLTDTFHFSCSVMSNSLKLHGLQPTRFSCPSPTLGVCSNSCPLSWWLHPSISSSAILFSSCLQSFPASGSFQNESALCIRWPKYWSFSFSISPSNEYSWFPLGLTCWTSWQSKWLSRVFSNTTVQNHQFTTQLSL